MLLVTTLVIPHMLNVVAKAYFYLMDICEANTHVCITYLNNQYACLQYLPLIFWYNLDNF